MQPNSTVGMDGYMVTLYDSVPVQHTPNSQMPVTLMWCAAVIAETQLPASTPWQGQPKEDCKTGQL